MTIIVTAGSDEKCAAVRTLGADHAINYKTGDFVERVAAITGGKGVQVVLDMVGGDYVPRNLKCLAEEGRHVSIAVQGGLMATIPIFEVMRRRLTLTGSTLRTRSVDEKGVIARQVRDQVLPLFVDGRMKVVVHRVFPLREAAEAHRVMEASDHLGKIVLLA